MTGHLTLYHYTCAHSVPGILRDHMVLRPHEHPLLPELGPVIWFTDLDTITQPEVVGLTSRTLRCDRTEFRFQAPASSIGGLSWWPLVRERCREAVVADLERYGWPTRWWVATEPVTVTEE